MIIPNATPWGAWVGLILFPLIAWGWGWQTRARMIPAQRPTVDRRKIIQLLLAHVTLMILFLKVPLMQKGFLSMGRGLDALSQAVGQGTQFVFGYLGSTHILPFAVHPDTPASTYILAFQGLPAIAVMSALSMVLFHWRILPFVMRALSWVTRPVARIGGALATGMGALVFVSPVEAALLVRPYLGQMSRHELFSLMVGGMATGSISILAVYMGFLKGALGEDALRHILTAWVVNIPASLLMAEWIIPHQGKATEGGMEIPHPISNSMHAIVQGAQEGWSIVWNIVAVLLVVTALIALVNEALSHISLALSGGVIHLQDLLAPLWAPWAWCMGIAKDQLLAAGCLLAEKTVFNEIIALSTVAKHTLASVATAVDASGVEEAYRTVSQGVALSSGTVSPRTLTILIYSLCNFSNFSNVGLTIAGLGRLAPNRMSDVTRLALRSLIAGLLASGFSSAVAALILS